MAVQTVVLCGVGAEVAKSGEDASAHEFGGKATSLRAIAMC